MTHPARLPADELLRDCEFRRTRRSGPGGQHRNKVETAVVVEHLPTGIRAEANERRVLQQNQQLAIHRLRVKLAIQIRTSPETAPSGLWLSRTPSGRLVVSDDHDDYPALLAEALDFLAAAGFDLAVAAGHLGISRTQLTRFLQSEPQAWLALNEGRHQQGLPTYR
jgi:hypothetical protein